MNSVYVLIIKNLADMDEDGEIFGVYRTPQQARERAEDFHIELAKDQESENRTMYWEGGGSEGYPNDKELEIEYHIKEVPYYG